MTRSHKQNDRDHSGASAGTANDRLPRFFAKNGPAGTDPKKVKKNGAGKGGWGVEGEEIQDSDFVLNKARRRSNSSSYAAGLKDFKTKFEDIETEPVFEESIHGAGATSSGSPPSTAHSDSQFADSIEKVNTLSSESSVDLEEKAKVVDKKEK